MQGTLECPPRRCAAGKRASARSFPAVDLRRLLRKSICCGCISAGYATVPHLILTATWMDHIRANPGVSITKN
jgi:hypothetical protein